MDQKLFDKPIRFAFAVNLANVFEPKHFGDADKYLIYEWVKHEFILLNEEVNLFKNLYEGQGHGLQEKGRAIIDFLRSLNITVLVSKQFGKNIQMVNRHFIPVIVSEDIPEKTLDIPARHMKWIEDEINNRPDEFKLFIIKNGVLKKSIKKE
jgi:predicted Fe-Mo cluster-binding NifX family protein